VTGSLPPLTLVVGGARSGKSAFAERLITAPPAPAATSPRPKPGTTRCATASPATAKIAARPGPRSRPRWTLPPPCPRSPRRGGPCRLRHALADEPSARRSRPCSRNLRPACRAGRLSRPGRHGKQRDRMGYCSGKCACPPFSRRTGPPEPAPRHPGRAGRHRDRRPAPGAEGQPSLTPRGWAILPTLAPCANLLTECPMTRFWLVRHGPTHAKAMIGWTDLAADLSDQSALRRGCRPTCLRARPWSRPTSPAPLPPPTPSAHAPACATTPPFAKSTSANGKSVLCRGRGRRPRR
jgi:hypothetical protein